MKACRRLAPGDLPSVTRMFNAAVDAEETTADVAHRTIAQVDAWLGAPASAFESFVVDAAGTGEIDETGAGESEASAGLVAWASLTRHHERAAYGPTAELSIYVVPGARRQGLGLAVATHMLDRAASLSLHSLVTLLFAHRPEAMRLATRLAFSKVGTLAAVYPRVLPGGVTWLDVTLWQRSLVALGAPKASGP
jgi:L-amino acid N-acyltransferase YncA